MNIFENIDFKEGHLLLIDKPQNWTSFDVVNKVRYVLKKHLHLKKFKVGHSGTLDPLATGLLLLCTGKFTKKLTDLTGKDKVYTGKIFLGETTPSLDRETEVNATYPIDHINETLINKKTKDFTGEITQTPPIFSAIKVDGVRLHKLARQNVNATDVKIKSREVTIHDFTIDKIELPYIHFTVHCSKGTYIRTLVDDFAKALGSGGVLEDLRRTKIGDFDIADALQLQDILESINNLPLTPKP